MFVIPDLFTPYVEGRELGIKRNWDDMQNYNAVERGQLDNAKALATFNADVNRAYEILNQLGMANDKTAQDLALRDLAMNGLIAQQDALAQARRQTAQDWALARLGAELSGYGQQAAANRYSQSYASQATPMIPDFLGGMVNRSNGVASLPTGVVSGNTAQTLPSLNMPPAIGNIPSATQTPAAASVTAKFIQAPGADGKYRFPRTNGYGALTPEWTATIKERVQGVEPSWALSQALVDQGLVDGKLLNGLVDNQYFVAPNGNMYTQLGGQRYEVQPNPDTGDLRAIQRLR